MWLDRSICHTYVSGHFLEEVTEIVYWPLICPLVLQGTDWGLN